MVLEPFEPTEVVVPNKSQTPAKRKASTQRTSENFPVQSFRTLLTNLATITKNRVQPKWGGVSVSFDKLTIPNSSAAESLRFARGFTDLVVM